MRRVQSIPTYFLTIEGEQQAVKKIVYLSDFYCQINALAIVFLNDSYAIFGVPSGQLIEYCLSENSFPYSDNQENYYGGPLNYFQKCEADFQHLVTKELISLQTVENEMTNQKSQSKTQTHHSENKRYDEWVGIPENRFFAYRNWRTPSGYLCGTYASTVLLAYYQDYLDEAIIPSRLREKNENRYEDLAGYLRRFIQPHGLPTIPFQVGFGLSRYFDHFKLNYRARTTVIGSWNRAIKRIQQGKPVAVGILKILGSTYGNHWVTAYAYLEKSDGTRYYKIHDNWGNYNKVIHASWGNGTVSLP
ncbi:hypothetical protein RV11_GL001977 [Enterococcus phoeniculicola]|jgi:hypothetical protein|uniref:Peptidase C39-like domain-containing protein n=1 Tax=Enterococcus phoeniculicola ATCC BAA-412 TaxID=1158610 RepID=R3W478_9ENTE|nr:hypothetical protein [Enterococcus phoeniculicola]EOL42427.1 hypothetical protein UC3_02779 [Enterococcus phoeniculicola ATCC BAA-412]EOT79294.1 hypothetical protein I589_00802 [Enterococcus phoeniculicola ATCC BAA-412]OJG73167.1 hypothetical protein RV11_GL001977 [Enterococcus phoeniculicola]